MTILTCVQKLEDHMFWNPKFDIINNKPIEENLHVIMVISNPCNFKKRYKLAREFVIRMGIEKNVILYIVEVAYGDQTFQISDESNERHLRIQAEVVKFNGLASASGIGFKIRF